MSDTASVDDPLAIEMCVYSIHEAPEHVAYAIVEADSPGAVTRCLNTINIKQDFNVTPVQRLQEVMEMAKAMIAK